MPARIGPARSLFLSPITPPLLSFYYATIPPAVENVPITITILPTGSAKLGGSIALTAFDVLGSFDSSTKTLPAGGGGISFVYTPTETGDLTITMSNTLGYHNAPPLVITITS